MKKEQIEQLIRACKYEPELRDIFWERVAYWWFFTDLNEIWLVIQPIQETKENCYNSEIVQFQIIDWAENHTRLEIKWFMDIISMFLESKLKNFSWFETLAVWDLWDEIILQNNKNRYVFSKRFNFYFPN